MGWFWVFDPNDEGGGQILQCQPVVQINVSQVMFSGEPAFQRQWHAPIEKA